MVLLRFGQPSAAKAVDRIEMIVIEGRGQDARFRTDTPAPGHSVHARARPYRVQEEDRNIGEPLTGTVR